MHLARRSIGLSYKALPYNKCFQRFCETIWRYQYTTKQAVYTDGIAEWLYEHSAGVIGIVVSLIKEAQEIAILTGEEVLTIQTMDKAYRQRMGTLQDYIRPSVRKKSQTGTKKKQQVLRNPTIEIFKKKSPDNYNSALVKESTTQDFRFSSASCINAFRSSMNAPPSMYFFVKILYHYENIVS